MRYLLAPLWLLAAALISAIFVVVNHRLPISFSLRLDKSIACEVLRADHVVVKVEILSPWAANPILTIVCLFLSLLAASFLAFLAILVHYLLLLLAIIL